MKINRRAFTLVELLIVVGIIAILALIAVPNFLEAQTRSKIARAKSDIRTIKGALAAYQVDNQIFPPAAVGDFQLPDPLTALEAPVAYMTDVPRDPFGMARFDFAPAISMIGYNYKDAASTSINMPAETYGHVWKDLPEAKYMLHSCGPNRIWDVTPYVEYDPTNGTLSTGDIAMFGP
jgi:type II secretion system protein G